MIVVSNTSPLNYLILIDATEVLPKLYQRILVPAKVLEELADSRSPRKVRDFAKLPPSWLLEQTPLNVQTSLKLHAGEAHAIALAQEVKADRLLIDERRGYEATKQLGLRPTGILGVLYEASGRDLVDLPLVISQLMKETNFHCDRKVIEEVLRRGTTRGDKSM